VILTLAGLAAGLSEVLRAAPTCGFDQPPSHLPIDVTPAVRATIAKYAASISKWLRLVMAGGSCAGAHGAAKAGVASEEPTSESSDDEECSASDSDRSEIGEEEGDEDDAHAADLAQPQHARPLTVCAIKSNLETACADCVFQAAPLVLSAESRPLPVGISVTVSVVVHPDRDIVAIPTCATINEVSRVFEYTEDQHVIFAIGARAFLQLLALEDVCDTVDVEILAAIQRLLFVHGMGGSGKSHVIRGWIALCSSWSRHQGPGDSRDHGRGCRPHLWLDFRQVTVRVPALGDVDYRQESVGGDSDACLRRNFDGDVSGPQLP